MKRLFDINLKNKTKEWKKEKWKTGKKREKRRIVLFFSLLNYRMDIEGTYHIALRLKWCCSNTRIILRIVDILEDFKQEGQEALNRSPEYTDQKSNI